MGKKKKTTAKKDMKIEKDQQIVNGISVSCEKYLGNIVFFKIFFIFLSFIIFFLNTLFAGSQLIKNKIN